MQMQRFAQARCSLTIHPVCALQSHCWKVRDAAHGAALAAFVACSAANDVRIWAGEEGRLYVQVLQLPPPLPQEG